MNQNQNQNPQHEIDDLLAQDMTSEGLDPVTAAGFTTAGSFFTAGTASCPASAGTAGSFSSVGG